MQTLQLMTSWPLHYFIISNFGQGHVLQKIPRFFVKLVITWWMARAWCGNSAHSLGGRKGSVPSGALYQCSGLCSPPCGLMLRRNGAKDWPCSITEASKQQFFRLEVKLLNYLNRTGWQKKHMDLWMFSSSLLPTFRPQCLATNLSRSFSPLFLPFSKAVENADVAKCQVGWWTSTHHWKCHPLSGRHHSVALAIWLAWSGRRVVATLSRCRLFFFVFFFWGGDGNQLKW